MQTQPRTSIIVDITYRQTLENVGCHIFPNNVFVSYGLYLKGFVLDCCSSMKDFTIDFV